MPASVEDRWRSLEALYEEIRNDPHYRTGAMGAVLVPGAGRPSAPVALVGEAPGREEERTGRPFAGPAGRNLDRLLAGIGWDREGVFITNVVKYRPMSPTGANRKPTTAERCRALPFLERELEILAARRLVCLGLSAAAALLGRTDLKMRDANGRWFEADGRELLVTYHPSPFNYSSPHKRRALEVAFRRLAEVGGVT